MDKNSFHHISQTSSTHGGQDNEDLLALSLSSGIKPSSSAPAPLPQPISSPFNDAAAITPQTLFNYQHFYPIPQAPPLPSSYHQTPHSPNDLFNPNDNNIFPQDIIGYSNQIPQAPPLPSSYHPNGNRVSQEIVNVNHSHPSRPRKNPDPKPKAGKTETIPPPFPWTTSQRATVHSLDYLLSHNVTKISGEVQCKKCNKVNKIEYDLSTKFREVASFILENRFSMHCRAPSSWNNPKLPSCESCGSCTKPVISKKRSINWLFLLLGGMLGCCKLSELKYFCKHSKNHRTGAKDRVLYLTYLGLCKQLDPDGPFDI